MKPYDNRIERSCTLPKWDVIIEPESGEIISCELPYRLSLVTATDQSTDLKLKQGQFCLNPFLNQSGRECSG